MTETAPDIDARSAPSRQTANRIRSSAIVLVIVGISIATRFYSLGREALWMDEAASLRATSGGFAQVLDHVRHFEVTPPLYFLLLEASSRLLGSDDIALRLPSALGGVAMVLVLMGIAGRISGTRGSFAAGAFAAVSWILIYYSQEARAYALFLLLAAVSSWLAIQLLRRQTPLLWIAYCIVCTLLIYTHFGAVFVMAAHACGTITAAIGAKQELRLSLLRTWITAAGVVATLSLPALQLASVVGQRAPGIEARTWASVMQKTEAYVFYAGGWLPLTAFASLAIVGLRSDKMTKPERAMLIALAALPVIGHLLIWRLGGPFFTPRHGLAAMLGMIFLAAVGIAALPRKTSAIVGGVVASVLLINTLQNNDRFRKPDVRQAARFVADRAESGDTVVVSFMMTGWSFDRYFPRTDLRRRNYDEFTIGQIARGQEGMQRLWLVLNPLPNEQRFLEIDNPMRIVSRTEFYQVTVVELERKPD